MAAFKIDFYPDGVLEWRRTASGVQRRQVPTYSRTCYLAGPRDAREDAEAWLEAADAVEDIRETRMYRDLRADTREPVLAVEIRPTVDPQSVARRCRQAIEHDAHAPGTLQWYNVDLAPQFRYCLETGTDPAPDDPSALSTLSVTLDEKAIADRDVSDATIDGDHVDGGEEAVLETLVTALKRHDPDVLVINAASLIPLLAERALATGIDLELGRAPGWERLAGENTFESYGRVGHSAARYNVPGRVILDTSNSFLWPESSLAGLLYLVEQSHKPLQETAWGSIGNILTSIQIREAHKRDVLVPWNKWEPELFKDVPTLHTADRGGFIMDPAVGFHEDVYELDFSSLYPAIMCEYNISPDTVLCTCHADREDVPAIGYNVCDDSGFIADVLQPLLNRREAAKSKIAAAPDEDACRDERAISGAIKWILVSCFGYQGYRNSKFGRIECHEAINAVARDIFLSSKRTLEAGGWQVVHGIVDSIWVTPASESAPTPLDGLADRIGTDVNIPLECEAHYDWVAFVPRRGTDRGALTRYIAKRVDGDECKLRGIEARQRSTCAFVAEAQRDLIETLDRSRDAATVVDRAERYHRELEQQAVDPRELVITRRVSKPKDAYTQATLSVAALERAERLGITKGPGQSVEYVVVDDGARTSGRVRLAFEEIETYDADYYAERLLRATESVVSPLGWDRNRLDRYRRGTANTTLAAF